MRVTLTKRLGQNKPGTIIDTTITQARWMFERGVAVAAPEAKPGEQAASTEQGMASTHTAGDDSAGSAAKTRARRGIAKAAEAVKISGRDEPTGGHAR